MIRTVSIYTIMVLIWGCSSDSSNSNTPTPTPAPTPTVLATFSNVQQLVFTASCMDASCHDSSAGGGLDLSPSVSYAALVGVAAKQTNAAARGKILVVAGDPTNSFLLQKLDGTLLSDEGDRMPKVGTVLANSKINLVRTWIEDGAQNN